MLFPKKVLKHYGLFRSGTNYFEAMVQRNYNVVLDLEQYGWKHGEIENTPPLDTVLVTKNLYAWLVSLYNYALSSKRNNFLIPAGISFSDFIRRRYCWIGDTGFNSEKLVCKADNPVYYWNKMMGHWLSKSLNHIVRYEDLLKDPEKTLRPLSLRRRNKILEYPDGNLLPGSAGKGIVNFVSEPTYDKIDYYLKSEYLKEYAGKDFAFVAYNVQYDLMWKLMYPLL